MITDTFHLTLIGAFNATQHIELKVWDNEDSQTHVNFGRKEKRK